MLTQMATFEKVIEDKLIIPVVVGLPRRQFYDRCLYAFPDCFEWMKEMVPTLKTGRRQSAFTPAEQLILRLQQWLSGQPLKKGPMFKEMEYPKDNDVWSLKTDDLRLWGWMYRPKKLIIASCGYADDYKEPTKTKNYADDVRAVMQARDALPLDWPKLVRGKFDELV
jgi:hypothetical protein